MDRRRARDCAATIDGRRWRRRRTEDDRDSRRRRRGRDLDDAAAVGDDAKGRCNRDVAENGPPRDDRNCFFRLFRHRRRNHPARRMERPSPDWRDLFLPEVCIFPPNWKTSKRPMTKAS